MATTTPRRPKMTADEARSFDATSLRSFSEVMEQLQCECLPYRDVYTFRRWKAQGYYVRKGQKAIQYSTWIKPDNGRGDDDENDDDQEQREDPQLIMKRVSVFCRCQVEAKE